MACTCTSGSLTPKVQCKRLYKLPTCRARSIRTVRLDRYFQGQPDVGHNLVLVDRAAVASRSDPRPTFHAQLAVTPLHRIKPERQTLFRHVIKSQRLIANHTKQTLAAPWFSTHLRSFSGTMHIAPTAAILLLTIAGLCFGASAQCQSVQILEVDAGG